VRLDLDNPPAELGEFVVVHELVYLPSTSHGPMFNSHMAAHPPRLEEQAMRLRSYQRIEATIKNSELPGCYATLDDEEAPA
jgi:predicted metal-dependent hydrolase